MFVWNSTASGHDKAAVLAFMLVSDDFQHIVSSQHFNLSHFVEWFYLEERPLTLKEKAGKALQKRLAQGKQADRWGGFELYMVRMSERFATVRKEAVSECSGFDHTAC